MIHTKTSGLLQIFIIRLHCRKPVAKLILVTGFYIIKIADKI